MITYQQEELRDVLDEMRPLFDKHWEEVAWYKESIKLNPDYDTYLAMAEMGRVVVVTARDEGELVGYNVMFLHTNLHYSDHVYGMNDIIFLHPDYRHSGIAKELIDLMETVLLEKGVSVITYHMKLAHPFESLMEECGFGKQEILFSKRLGE